MMLVKDTAEPSSALTTAPFSLMSCAEERTRQSSKETIMTATFLMHNYCDERCFRLSIVRRLRLTNSSSVISLALLGFPTSRVELVLIAVHE